MSSTLRYVFYLIEDNRAASGLVFFATNLAKLAKIVFRHDIC